MSVLTTTPTPAKRTPIRTCVACRTSGGKRGLLRIVRLPKEGGVALDLTGKQSGRGAYVCPTTACVALAIKKKQLDRSLKTTLPETLLTELREKAADSQNESPSLATNNAPPA